MGVEFDDRVSFRWAYSMQRRQAIPSSCHILTGVYQATWDIPLYLP